MGHATFKVLDDLSVETRVEIISASYEREVEVGDGGASVLIGGTPSEPCEAADFDGDGKVEFSDFILFARHFGKCDGDTGHDPKYDLDNDGCVGFSDFIQFARCFGQQVAKPALSRPTGSNLPGTN